eukprot:m.53302 g.53302  ORF g.53302 m.53302 type:complete len:170 (+) comp10856_c0_seq1:226-735(+)
MGKSVRKTRKTRQPVTKSLNSIKKVRKKNSHQGREAKIIRNILNPVVAQAWDKEKTVQQNFVDMGLTNDANKAFKNEEEGEGKKKKAQTAVVKELEELAAKAMPTVTFASAGEIEFVQELTNKYGSDYVAMSRDHQLNTYQHTPKQLQRKIEKVKKSLQLAEKHMNVEE